MVFVSAERNKCLKKFLRKKTNKRIILCMSIYNQVVGIFANQGVGIYLSVADNTG